MTRLFSDAGECIPVTVLEAGPNTVVQKKTEAKDGYAALQLGYGERLLDEILHQAAGAEVREVFLEVRPSNANAIALYVKKGFRQIASRPAYYQAREGREDARESGREGRRRAA